MRGIADIIKALRCISTFSGVCDNTCIYHKKIDVALGECECSKVVRDAADALERMTATDSIDDGMRILMIMGTDCGYDGMNWMDKHGFRECYDYVGGFADRFSWIRSGLEKLNHGRLMDLFNHFVMGVDGHGCDVDRTAADAAEALEAKPRWIPVAERLPEDDKNVIVCVDGIVET